MSFGASPGSPGCANCLRFQVPKGLGYWEALAANSIWRYAELTPLVWPEQGEAAPRVGEPPLARKSSEETGARPFAMHQPPPNQGLGCTSHCPTNVFDAPATHCPTKVFDAPATAQGFDAPATRQPRIPMLQPPPNQGFRCTGHPATNPSKIFDAPAPNQDFRCSRTTKILDAPATPQPSHPDQDFQCSGHPQPRFSMLQGFLQHGFGNFRCSSQPATKIFDAPKFLQHGFGNFRWCPGAPVD